MSYTPEQLREWANQIGMHDYNYASPRKADIEEQLRAHADALDEIESLKAKLGRYEREDTIKANANATLLRQVETMQAKLKVAEEAIAAALPYVLHCGGDREPHPQQWLVDQMRAALTAIRGAK